MDLKKHIGERIKLYRESQGMSQDDLATLLETTKQSVSRYERGDRQANQDVLFHLSKIFKVSVDDFFPVIENLKNIEQTTVKIPVLGEIACGAPLLVRENVAEYRVTLSANLPKGDLFYLQAKGDSMSPTITDGSMVLVRQQSDVESGEIAAATFNGNTEATLKRVRKQGDTIILTPDNNHYEPIISTRENPVRIIGKAIKVEMDL